jgi:hypothetical protein
MTQTQTPAIAGYIAITDGIAIYGVGSTPEDATRDAVSEVGGDVTAGDFTTHPASAALIADVMQAGGFIAWYDVDGVKCTQEERDAYHGAARCECGQAMGEWCGGVVTAADRVVVEWMPEYLRASHVAAGNSGTWPANGAVRLAVTRACAEVLCADDEWVHVVERA